jgi:RecA-family ATPase
MWLLFLFIAPKKRVCNLYNSNQVFFCHHSAKVSQKTKNKNTGTLVVVLCPKLNFGWYEAAIDLVLRLDKQIWYKAGIT